MNIAIGIASHRRCEDLSETLRWLGVQERAPDRVLVSVADSGDVDLAVAEELGTEVLRSEAGLPRQRNTILDALEDEDVIVFIDDDYLLQVDFCEQIERFMADHPEINAGMGRVIRDGAREDEGISFEEGVAILEKDSMESDDHIDPTFNTYGCNMFFRVSEIREKKARFDERLVLYGWLEDVDFSRQISGDEPVPVVRCLAGVHLASGSGRSPGKRLGYSQVINPLYLAKKGTVPWKYAIKHAGRNVAGNLLKLFVDSKKVDRWGRLKGNLLALFFVIAGKLKPERAAKL